ncbi:MAG: S-methyl-5-thioribose-1-phosphate isomerase [Phycisphaerae bacterium]|nr:S-methyl-5-thioribose-1-phosphate isomerase [Phycisphaerae bacterium]
MNIRAVRWQGGIDGFLELIDQRKLPAEFVTIKVTQIEQLFDAIKTLAVRGAPAIGVAAAYSPVITLRHISKDSDISLWRKVIQETCESLAKSRPTAVNLFWALDRMKNAAEKFLAQNLGAALNDLRKALLEEADRICAEDIEMCKKIGQNGEHFIKAGSAILTHCNAGALATAGQGTALSVLYEAHKKGRKFKVYVDETRPLLQGARLTAWELQQAGIETILICDNMAGWLMKNKMIDACLTGADRIAANGDTANKIGTYPLAVLAKEHGLPFYIAAPSSTFDLSIESGEQIPVEQRDPAEITSVKGTPLAPAGTMAYNPAFDVTDGNLITAIITEKSVIQKPYLKNIRSYVGKS